MLWLKIKPVGLLNKSQKARGRMPVPFSRGSRATEGLSISSCACGCVGRGPESRCPPPALFLSLLCDGSPGSLPVCFFTSRPALCSALCGVPPPPPASLPAPGSRCLWSPPGPQGRAPHAAVPAAVDMAGGAAEGAAGRRVRSVQEGCRTSASASSQQQQTTLQVTVNAIKEGVKT